MLIEWILLVPFTLLFLGAFFGLRWGDDKEQVYRMKQMAELIMTVLPKFLHEGDDQLPQESTIRKWIKPYAPTYASKPGREPQKKSKSTKNS